MAGRGVKENARKLQTAEGPTGRGYAPNPGERLPLRFRDACLIEYRHQRSLRQGAVAVMGNDRAAPRFGIEPASMAADAVAHDEAVGPEMRLYLIGRERLHANAIALRLR